MKCCDALIANRGRNFMLKFGFYRVYILALVLVLLCGNALGQQPAPAADAAKQDAPYTLLASLRPTPELHWQRVSPSTERPDGPVLYQLLFSAAGTTGTVAKFDTNPRHL